MMLKSSTERRDSVTLFTSFLICQSPKTRKTSRQKSGYSWSNKGEQANNGWFGSIPNIAQKGLAYTATINLAICVFAKIILPISVPRNDDKLPSVLSKNEGTISHVGTIVSGIGDERVCCPQKSQCCPIHVIQISMLPFVSASSCDFPPDSSTIDLLYTNSNVVILQKGKSK